MVGTFVGLLLVSLFRPTDELSSGTEVSSGSPPTTFPFGACVEAVAAVEQTEGADMNVVARSLDSCRSEAHWELAVRQVSEPDSPLRGGSLDYCRNSTALQRTFVCVDAIRLGLITPIDVSPSTTVDVEVPSNTAVDVGPSNTGVDNGPANTTDNSLTRIVSIGRFQDFALDNRLSVQWGGLDESGESAPLVPFTYRITGPIPIPVSGTALSGRSDPIRVPGWAPGMTIRVELTSIDDPSVVLSVPFTFVDYS